MHSLIEGFLGIKIKLAGIYSSSAFFVFFPIAIGKTFSKSLIFLKHSTVDGEENITIAGFFKSVSGLLQIVS